MTNAKIPHSPAPSPHLTRLAFVGRMWRVLVFPFMTVLLGHFVLFYVEQAQEAVQATLDDGWRDGWSLNSRLIWYALGYFVWGLSAWYTARLLLCKRWGVDQTGREGRATWSDPIGLCVDAAWAKAWVTWLPRALAVMSTLPSAGLMWWRGQWLAASVLSLGAAVLLLGLVFRRRVMMMVWPQTRQAYQLGTDRVPNEQWERFDHISPGGRAVLLALSLLPWVIVLVGAAGGQALLTPVARHIGTPGLVLLALASYNVLGSMLLLYMPMKHGWGSWAWVPALFWLVFSWTNENHQIGKRDSVPAPVTCPRSPGVDLIQWMDRRQQEGRQNDPIYLVAMSGGASRAAYWGGYTLAWLDDMQRAKQAPFMANVYALSGVSGGSLGASALVSALASSREVSLKGPTPPVALADWMSEVLTQDHLSPVSQSLLFVDLAARLSPWPLPALDRSHALERTWEDDTLGTAAAKLSRPADGLTNWFRLPIESLYDADTPQCAGLSSDASRARCLSMLPRLILNSASAETGEPVLQTPLALTHPLAIYMRDPALALGHMTLSEAIHNSARFPYLSPAGQVVSTGAVMPASPCGAPLGAATPPQSPQPHVGVDYWVDGGYYENSGAWSLQVLLRQWAQSPELAQNEARWRELVSHLRVIVFSNDPVTADSPSWLPDADGTSSSAVRAFPPRSSWMMEVLAPGLGLYATRTARANAETFRLAQTLTQMRAQVALPKAPVVYQLRMPLTTAETPSMNWFINKRSSCVLRSYVHGQDQCTSSGVPAMPPDWGQSSGYVRYRAELNRLMAELQLPQPPAPPPEPMPGPVQATRSKP